MSSTRVLPYRSLGPDGLRPAWWYERLDGRLPLPELLPAWDYAREESVGATVEILRSEVEDATGLASLDALALVLVADCPSLLCRFTSERHLDDADEQQVELSVRIPAGEVANKLELTVHLVLVEELDAEAGRAFRTASRIGSSLKRRLILEGEASRFPTEAVSFADLGLENAPWTVRMAMDGLDDSFMGAVRLLVNEDHPLGQALLDPTTAPTLSGRLKMDVIRTVLAEIASFEVEPAAEYEDESVGAVLTSMCELFLARSLSEAIKLYRDEPAKFDRVLYAAVDL